MLRLLSVIIIIPVKVTYGVPVMPAAAMAAIAADCVGCGCGPAALVATTTDAACCCCAVDTTAGEVSETCCWSAGPAEAVGIGHAGAAACPPMAAALASMARGLAAASAAAAASG